MAVDTLTILPVPGKPHMTTAQQPHSPTAPQPHSLRPLQAPQSQRLTAHSRKTLTPHRPTSPQSHRFTTPQLRRPRTLKAPEYHSLTGPKPHRPKASQGCLGQRGGSHALHGHAHLQLYLSLGPQAFRGIWCSLWGGRAAAMQRLLLKKKKIRMNAATQQKGDPDGLRQRRGPSQSYNMPSRKKASAAIPWAAHRGGGCPQGAGSVLVDTSGFRVYALTRIFGRKLPAWFVYQRWGDMVWSVRVVVPLSRGAASGPEGPFHAQAHFGGGCTCGRR